MALKKGDVKNFRTLLKAVKSGHLCLMQSSDVATGEYRALLAACVQDETGEFVVTPFGHLCTGNPYEQYSDPTVEDVATQTPLSNEEN